MYNILSGNRERIISALKKESIDSRPFFYGLHEMPQYKNGNSYPVTEEISRKGLSLPPSTNLGEEEIELICGIIKSAT